MNEESIRRFIASEFAGVDADIGSKEAGAPEIAWGDTFFIYDPQRNLEGSRRFPFATIVTKDYGDFDDKSNLNRPRSEEHTSELQSHSDLPSFPTRRSSDLSAALSPRSSLASMRTSGPKRQGRLRSHGATHSSSTTLSATSKARADFLSRPSSPRTTAISTTSPTSTALDRKSTRLNSSHTVISPLSLHDALPIYPPLYRLGVRWRRCGHRVQRGRGA